MEILIFIFIVDANKEKKMNLKIQQINTSIKILLLLQKIINKLQIR